jgi:hypothetical protein
MDPQETAPDHTQTSSPPAHPDHHQTPSEPKKHHGFIGWVGKIFLFLLLAGIFLGGGYMLGLKANTADISSQPNIVTATPTETPPSPTQVSQKVKTVKAGLATATAFKPYSIEIPDGWTDTRENTETAAIDKLTITKTGYSLTIYQAALGGGGCTYKGDPLQQQAETFTDFTQINGKSGELRRSWNQTDTPTATITYTICQKNDDSTYGTLTKFGRIDAVSPNTDTADPTTLKEIDGMIASLEEQ